MIYIVSYMYVIDDYKDAGASTETLGVFSDEESAYKCAIQKYCEKILHYDHGLQSTLEEKLLGTPEEVYSNLNSWRDELFEPEFTRDSVGPMVFVESKKTLKDWDLDGFFKKAGLNVDGKSQGIIDELTTTKSGKIGSKGIEELLSKMEKELSFGDAEKIVERVGMTSSANKKWKEYLQKKTKEEDKVESKAQKMSKQEKNIFKKALEMVNVEFEDGNFQVMKYQVTQRLWEIVTGRNPSKFKGPNRPVQCVSWFDCVIFANKLSEKFGLEKVYDIPKELTLGSSQDKDLAMKVRVNKSANGYRLPTNSEWEYAAKGGEDYKYAGSNNADEVAWYCDNSRKQARPVGKKKANGYGLYDMSGNVNEWCFCLAYDDKIWRVSRGGDWSLMSFYSTITETRARDASKREDVLGVRLFRSLPQDS